MTRQKYIAVLVPLLVVLASAVAFGVHYNMVSYSPSGISFHISAAHADGGEGDGGGGSGGGSGNDGGNDNGGDGGGGSSDIGSGNQGDGGGGSGDVGNGGNQGDGGGGSGDVGGEGDGGGGSGDIGGGNQGGNDSNPPPAPVWTVYCTGGNDAGGHDWQWWEHDNSNPVQYRFVRTGDGTCVPPAPTLSAVCSASGTEATLSWTAVAGANAYSASVVPYGGASCPSGWTTSTATGALSCQTPPTTLTSITVPVVPGKPTTGIVYAGNTANPGVWSAPATKTFTCSVPIVQTPVPTCTLTANPKTINAGDSSTLSWTSTNATTVTIDKGIGGVSPVAAGSTSVSPANTTTYTETVTGSGGTATCTATVTVVPKQPGAPSCTLTASPTQVSSGGHTKLSWTTDNADTFTIDQGIGAVTPANAGSTTSKAITANTTFTGTVVSPSGKTATCTAAVTVQTGGGGGGPTCSLTVNPASYTKGAQATLSWSGTEISNVDIDNGIATATTSSGSVIVGPANVGTYTYTGTFHATNGQTLTCKATLTVTGGSGGGGGGGCTSNCGGGGGGGTPAPVITLSSLPHATTQPLTYLYLSQIPYTGLDLGPVGTVVYWLMLIGWSIALAYLVLFGVLPYTKRKLQAFGARVAETLNTPAAPSFAMESAAAAPAPRSAPVLLQQEAAIGEADDHYSAFDGFKSFAQNEALSVEDIVKGLARGHAAKAPEVVITETVPLAEVTPVQVTAPQEVAASAAHTEQTVPASVRGMVAAILEGDKEAVFAALRQHVRGGGEPEALLTPALCMIDDVYRSRIDGTPCDESISRLAARLDTPVLEKLVASLATAIDASYSTSVTGAKLALTRALTALGA